MLLTYSFELMLLVGFEVDIKDRDLWVELTCDEFNAKRGKVLYNFRSSDQTATQTFSSHETSIRSHTLSWDMKLDVIIDELVIFWGWQ